MKSDAALKTYVTFRIAGDSLDPDRVTEFLKIHPTQSRLKGKSYSTERSTVTAKTGVWMVTTDKFIASVHLHDHIALMFSLLTLGAFTGASTELLGRDTRNETFRFTSAFLRLRDFLTSNAATATMTFFWHGGPGAAYPDVPDSMLEFLHAVPIATETDFDRDEAVRSPRRRAA